MSANFPLYGIVLYCIVAAAVAIVVRLKIIMYLLCCLSVGFCAVWTILRSLNHHRHVTYVRPIVEINSVIWSPSTARDMDAVERVHRRFTKCFSGLRSMSFDDRLKYLNVPSLELKRLHADLFLCYKIVSGLAKVQSGLFFVTRGYKYKLYRRNNNVCMRSTFFTERVIHTWNRFGATKPR